MNHERIMELADAIEGRKMSDVGFNMRQFSSNHICDIENHPCGTTACIAGWCHLHFGVKDDDELALCTALGINKHDAYDIAYPHAGLDGARDGWDATPKQAATLLRNYAKTGVVDWAKAMEGNL